MGEWALVYDGYQPDQEGLREALCTLGNGYFATRGAAPDSSAGDIHYPGTYLAGGYNRLETEISGRMISNEDLVNLPNWLPLTFRIDGGDWFRIDDVDVLSYRQSLDLKHGVLHRKLRFRDKDGRTTAWDERRLVSMADPHLAGMSLRLTAEDWSGELAVRSGLDGGVINAGVPRYRSLASRHLETQACGQPGTETISLTSRTNQSRIEIAFAARTRLFLDGRSLEAERETEIGEDEISQTLTCTARQGEAVDIEKIVALHTSRDRAISEPGTDAIDAVARAGTFDAVLAAHALAWGHIWDDCNIVLNDAANGTTTQRLRVHIFHLLQTVSPHSTDLDTGMPARGWHGESYRGHIFWDEIYIFPFLNLRMPMLTRGLLRYRWRRLPEARRAAREAGYKGAMYPWQSGSSGREESQLLHLNPKSGRWVPDNTFRQRHIGLAIAYNIWQYYQVTDDYEFMHLHGAEMLIEIARFWASIATYNPAIDRYEIKGVMGPDEYHTAYPGADPDTEGGIDNNAYTNVMAAWVMDRARDIVELMPIEHIGKLRETIDLAQDEIDLWDDISRKLRVPFHDEGIISQFDGYGDLEEFDWAGYTEKYGDIHRLDRILEAEGDTPNRYKVSKQADVLMLFYLFSADELAVLFEQLGYPFAPDMIPRTIDYYLARTSDGSTLSKVVHSWVLARSDRRRSWHLFQNALDSDIHDVQGGTTREGIHSGAMAGTLDLIQRCYVGVETRANALHFNPTLPQDLTSVRVQLRYRRQVLNIEVTHDRLKVASEPIPTAPITIVYRDHIRQVVPGETYEFRLLKPEDRDRDENRQIGTTSTEAAK